MKKLLIILSIVFASNALAIDVTSSEGQSSKSDIDKNINNKDSEESRNTKSKRKSYTEALENSKSKAVAVVKIEQTDILESLEALELQDIENYESGRTKSLGFWGSCSIITNPRLASDFGITAYDEEYDFVDNNLQSLIESYSKANTSIRKIVNKKQERDLREYMNCLLQYGVVGAQSLISGKFTLDIKDKSLIKLNKSGIRSLKRNKSCRFHKSQDTIQCGSLKIVLDYEPELSDKQISYYSKDRYLGLSGTETYTITDNESVRNEQGNSSESSNSNSSSKDKTITRRYSDSTDTNVKTEVSARNFFSKLFK